MINYYEVFYNLSGDKLFSQWSEQPFPYIQSDERVILGGKDYLVVRKAHVRAKNSVTTNFYVMSLD